MSKIDDSTRLQHMLEAATEACEMMANETRTSLGSDRKLALAFGKLSLRIYRLLFRIGERGAGNSTDRQTIAKQLFVI
ncbi:MAG: hypothetical protein HC780_25480 [Leptolyngbyaceae cyanobacterium CSU_1_3]|nr:hypothetical protein [Leptolyngbyaceae cyanobacterium CSU_1_3]